jgi:DNA-binding transcriptional MerR regulator
MNEAVKQIGIGHLASLMGVTVPKLQGWAEKGVLVHDSDKMHRRYGLDEVFIALVIGQLQPYRLPVSRLRVIASTLRDAANNPRDTRNGWAGEIKLEVTRRSVIEGGRGWLALNVDSSLQGDGEPNVHLSASVKFEDLEQFVSERRTATLIVDLKKIHDQVLRVFVDGVQN